MSNDVLSKSQKTALFVKGMLMGIANKIPGVSGGAIAWAFGFYQEMIDSFGKLNKSNFLIWKNDGFKAFYQKVNGRFLIILFSGSFLANFSISFVLDYLFDRYESYVWIYFSGLILATAYYLFKEISIKENIGFILLGIILGGIFSVLNPIPEKSALWFVFIAGYISVTGMTLPGLSGSFLLILLGMYKLCLVDTINNIAYMFGELVSGNLNVFQDTNAVHLLWVLLVFMIGSFVGLVTLSKLIKYLFKKHQTKTTAIIGAFIIGSIGIIWPWRTSINSQIDESVLLQQRFLPNLNIDLFYHFLIFIIGVLCVYGIEYRKTKSK